MARCEQVSHALGNALRHRELVIVGKALEGAAAKGHETKLVNLYDLKFTSCRECFACKRLGAPTFGKCIWPDDLKPLLEEIRTDCAALVVATPVFFLDFPGTVRSFFERLIFPAYPYCDVKDGAKSLFPRRMPVGLIVSMNVPEALAKDCGYPAKMWDSGSFGTFGNWIETFIGPYSALPIYDTWQFPDYSKYASTVFDPAHKAKVRSEQFPKDLQSAYDFGMKILSRQVV